jgi:stage II sporulation protein D
MNYFLKTNLITVPIITFILIFGSPLMAYENPILKVLLFKTSSYIDLKSYYGMNVSVQNHKSRGDFKVRFKYVGSKKISIDNRWQVIESIWIDGDDSIQVIRRGKQEGRRYRGKLELKPYRGGFYVINHIPIEKYLEGVLNAEISTDWDLDVVQAQAIISRTFALFKREQRLNKIWHVTAGYNDQVYLGENISDHRSRVAIDNTKGIVVNYQGKLAQTYYHSNCGGVTEDPANVWQFSLPYLKVKSVPYGQMDPRYFWEHLISFSELGRIASKAGINAYNINEFYIENRTESHRVGTVIFSNGNQSFRVEASQFRKLAGYGKIQSLLFDAIPTAKGYRFQGTGNGHGVGLCQWAAKEMAEIGFRFDDILRFFYTDTNIQIYKRL